VTEQLKGVCAPELDLTQHFIRNIDRNGFFEVTTLSKDDLKRNEMYKENLQRAKAEASFSDYKEYLLSLQMKGIIKEFEPIYYERISQLSNKSNQYNLTTRRYSVTDIEEMANDNSCITLYGKLIDRFGDNGLVSVVIGKIREDVCDIDLWIMSCRVLKRDLEYAMMDELVRRCKEKGIREIRGYYYPTAKNAMVKDFYSLQGFDKIGEDPQGNTVWSLLTENYRNKNEVIEVNDD
jgi:FkbH-like protein